LYVRGLIYLAKKMPEQAEADFLVAISRSGRPEPSNWSSLANLALYKLAAGEITESRELYQSLFENQVPKPALLEAANDLADFLILFPDSRHAREMEQLLRRRAAEAPDQVAPSV
jgi:hypothetical protein